MNNSNQQPSPEEAPVVKELAGIRNELREINEQLNKLNSKKLVTSNQIAIGIVKGAVAFSLLSIAVSVLFAVLFLSGLRNVVSPIDPTESPPSSQSSPQ